MQWFRLPAMTGMRTHLRFILLAKGIILPEIAVETPGSGDLMSGTTNDFGVVTLGVSRELTFVLQKLRADLILSGTPGVVVSGPDAADYEVTMQPESPVPASGARWTWSTPTLTLPEAKGAGWEYAPSGMGWIFGITTGVARDGTLVPECRAHGESGGVCPATAREETPAPPFRRTFYFGETGPSPIRFSVVRRGNGFEGTDLAVKMDGVTLGTVPHGSQPDDVWEDLLGALRLHDTGPAPVVLRGNAAGRRLRVRAGRRPDRGTTSSQVRFLPSAEGLRTARLSIANNDPDEDPYELTLTGTGAVSPRFQSLPERALLLAMSGPTTWARTCLPPPALAGWRVSRSSRSKTPARFDLMGLAVSLQGANAGDFVVGPLGATTLAPNASTTFTVTFVPTAGSVRRAVVSIASNDGDENPFEIPALGRGTVAPEIAVFTGLGNGSGRRA